MDLLLLLTFKKYKKIKYSFWYLCILEAALAPTLKTDEHQP